MSKSFYDVVVVGRRLGALVSAALLAKRGFRVLLVGHDAPASDYTVEGIALPRQPQCFPFSDSPVVRRVIAELALQPAFRRHAEPAVPLLQVALPGHRWDIPGSSGQLENELDREFPEIRRPLEDFHQNVSDTRKHFDALLELDLAWPPATFLERREFSRSRPMRLLSESLSGPDPLAEIPEDHPFYTAVMAIVRFSDRMDPDHTSPLRVLRPYASWLRESPRLSGGTAKLEEMLLDRIRTHGGEILKDERVAEIAVHRGQASGVRLTGAGEAIGSAFVISGEDLGKTLELLRDRRPFEALFERIGEPQPRHFRYTLNMVLRHEAVPSAMADNLFFVRDTNQPLSGDNLLRMELQPSVDAERRVLCVQALLPRRGIEDVPGYLDGMRERVLRSVRELIPFVDSGLVLVDSPHDGLPAELRSEDRLLEPEVPWTRGAASMDALYGYPVTQTLGVCALPPRTPIRKLLMANHQLAPGLGDEGLFLAGWTSARIVARADRRRASMRRGQWTKVEI